MGFIVPSGAVKSPRQSSDTGEGAGSAGGGRGGGANGNGADGRERSEVRGGGRGERDDEPAFVSGSYNWMVNTLSFFLREVWTLIRGDALDHTKCFVSSLSSNSSSSSSGGGSNASSNGSSNGSKEKRSVSMSYSRADLCEVITLTAIVIVLCS